MKNNNNIDIKGITNQNKNYSTSLENSSVDISGNLVHVETSADSILINNNNSKFLPSILPAISMNDFNSNMFHL